MSLTRLVDAFVSLSKSAAMATSVLSDWFECLSVWIVNIPTIALPVIRAPPQAPRPMPCPERGGVSLEMHEQRRALGPSGIPRFNGQGSSEVLRWRRSLRRTHGARVGCKLQNVNRALNGRGLCR